jgi:polyferredoxin
MSSTALIVLGLLALFSVFVKNFWCRYACPYGALLSFVSLASPVKIRRDQPSCIGCGQCTRACPHRLRVDRLIQVSSAECSACMECVASCPAENALQFSLAPGAGESAAQRWRGRRLQPAAVVIILAALFFGGIGFARLTGHWQTAVSGETYRQLIPQAEQAGHPGF